MSERFEWDPRKAAANLSKHGVSFDEAKGAFYDDHGLVMADPDHSEDEDRFVLLGVGTSGRLLVVVHLVREEDAIRIISARKATKRERTFYGAGSRQ
jgi:uncharacterized DUF497 family protein